MRRSNPEKGRLFQEKSRKALERHFGCPFEAEVRLPIAPAKLHAFDHANHERTVVANFPFSTNAWSNGVNPDNDPYDRFAFRVPPAKNRDYAFLLHILACLTSTGKVAVIHAHGVLFRGGAEATIRKEIVKRGHVKGIIGLSPWRARFIALRCCMDPRCRLTWR